MRSALTVIVLVGLLALSAAVALWAWQEIGEAEMSRHGLIALGLGVGVTFLLGAGLMTLVFLSDRRGYDERAHRPDDLPSRRGTERPQPPGRPEPPERS